MRTKLVVTYYDANGFQTSRFTDYGAALRSARLESLINLATTEVADKTGLIGQFAGGDPTPEFVHLLDDRELQR